MTSTVQEYDYHLSAVNTITFVDEGRRFVSTSDDKTIRVWELGIPVQVRRTQPFSCTNVYLKAKILLWACCSPASLSPSC